MGNNQLATQRSSKLPDEILGAEQCRSNYLKWKLFLVAALGASGFGLGGQYFGDEGQPPHLLLALIPFVCIYVDLLCTHLTLRILVIGSFYANVGHDLYEQFVRQDRKDFRMEDWALYWSTYAICLILILTGFLLQTRDRLCWHRPQGENLILVLAGSVGIALSIIIQLKARGSKKRIENLKSDVFPDFQD